MLSRENTSGKSRFYCLHSFLNKLCKGLYTALHYLTSMGQQEVYNFLKQNKNKWFTSKQISESIQYDCDIKFDTPERKTPKQWLLDKITKAKEDFKYRNKDYEAEVKRCKERTDWIQSLVKSLNDKNEA